MQRYLVQQIKAPAMMITHANQETLTAITDLAPTYRKALEIAEGEYEPVMKKIKAEHPELHQEVSQAEQAAFLNIGFDPEGHQAKRLTAEAWKLCCAAHQRARSRQRLTIVR